MAFDPKCLELAKYVLPSGGPVQVSEDLADRLAQHIQDSIEDWLSSESVRIAATIAQASRLQ